jgi:hypothetical protein
MSEDELTGNIIQIIADNLRLRADSQNFVADPLDQRGLPTGSDGAERVPDMTGDETELRGTNPKLLLDISIGLARRLMIFDAVTLKRCRRTRPIPPGNKHFSSRGR